MLKFSLFYLLLFVADLWAFCAFNINVITVTFLIECRFCCVEWQWLCFGEDDKVGRRGSSMRCSYVCVLHLFGVMSLRVWKGCLLRRFVSVWVEFVVRGCGSVGLGLVIMIVGVGSVREGGKGYV